MSLVCSIVRYIHILVQVTSVHFRRQENMHLYSVLNHDLKAADTSRA